MKKGLWLLLAWISLSMAAQETVMEDDGSSAGWWQERAESGRLNINQATRGELEALPFLNARQVEHLLEYRFDYKKFYTLYELALVPGLDSTAVHGLQQLCEAGPTRQEEDRQRWHLKYGRHQITVRFNQAFPRKRGFDDSTYLGKPWSGFVKYEFKQQHLTAAFTLEQDEGEPWDWKHGPGFDFHGGHLAIHRLKGLKSLILGDYKAHFAHGLVWNTGATFSRAAQASCLHENNTRLQPSYSTAEGGFLRGAAVYLEKEKWNLQAWASHTCSDHKSGYHRTLQEMAAKDTIACYAIGMHAGYDGALWQLGVQAACYPAATFHDSLQGNVSLDITCKVGKIYLSGELACDWKGRPAGIGKLQFFAREPLNGCLMVRYYAQNYQAPMANALKQGGRLQNEAGVTLHVQYLPWQGLQTSLYTDTYRTLGPSSTLPRPGYGYESRLTLAYNTPAGTLYELQYATYGKDKSSHGKKMVFQERKHQLKAVICQSWYPHWEWKSGGSLLFLLNENQTWSKGCLIYTRMQGKWEHWGIAAMLALFDTSGYNTRIYMYEHDVWQTLGSIACYDRGMRISFLLQAMWKHCHIYLKTGYTRYTDRMSVGTGAAQTQGPYRLDLHFLVRCNF